MTARVLFLDGPLVGQLWSMSTVLPHIHFAEPVELPYGSLERVRKYHDPLDHHLAEKVYEFIGGFRGDAMYRLQQ